MANSAGLRAALDRGECLAGLRIDDEDIFRGRTADQQLPSIGADRDVMRAVEVVPSGSARQ
jgi:hypothetical protein